MVCEERGGPVEADGEALARRLAPELAGMALGLVGPGQFYGRTGVERVTVVWVEPGPPRVAWDGPVLGHAVAPLQAALRDLVGALPGEVDTLHATPMSLAWSVAPAPALVANDQGVVLRARPDGDVELRGRVLPRAALRRVEAHLSDDWIVRAVRLVVEGARGEEALEVAERIEPMVAMDFTYDGLDLLIDGSWAPSLASALARQLELPVTVAPGFG